VLKIRSNSDKTSYFSCVIHIILMSLIFFTNVLNKRENERTVAELL